MNNVFYDANNNYLSNPTILEYIDNLKCQTQFIRIVVLNWKDQPLKAIEGRATGGSISINNNSAIRRSGSLTLVTDIDPKATKLDIMNEITNTDTLISMNKRVSIEIGIENTGNDYSQWNMFWIPLGVYIISNASISYDQNGIVISLKLNDKMTLLNGEAGGIIPAPTILTPTADNQPVLFYDLIENLVNQIGEIPKNKIVIEDIGNQIGELDIYANADGWYGVTEENKLIYSPDALNENGVECSKNTLLCKGVNFPFYYPDTLSTNAGDSVASVLEIIKNKLGNFEYFFDVDGVFHFREIKNYLNEGSALNNLTEAINEKYFIMLSRGDVTYSFNESNLITAYSNAPQFNQIKNDYHVWGRTSDSKTPLHYHLMIEQLPAQEDLRWWVVKKDIIEENGIDINVISEAKGYQNRADAEENGIKNILQTEGLAAADNTEYLIPKIKSSSMQQQDEVANEWALKISKIDNTLFVEPGNWRQKLYLDAIANNKKDVLSVELIDKLPTLMDVHRGDLESLKNNSLYFLDAINTNSGQLMQKVPVKQFSISNIGRRGKVINDESINCLFASSEVKDFALKNSNEEVIKVSSVADEADIYYNGIANAAYDALRSSLHQHLSYNNNITLTAIPIYHLDVNKRIRVENRESNIHGDYIIQNITLPLDLKGTMTINATQAIERI